MELTGNGANRWEQVSKKIGDLAFETDKQREQLEKLITELVDLAGHIRFNQEELTKLSGATFKEVLREGSMMLNDESPAVMPQLSNEGHAEPEASKESPIKTEQRKEVKTTSKTRTGNKKKTPNQQQLLPSENGNE